MEQITYQEFINNILEALNIDKSIRGETFATQDFIRLADELVNRNLLS